MFCQLPLKLIYQQYKFDEIEQNSYWRFLYVNWRLWGKMRITSMCLKRSRGCWKWWVFLISMHVYNWQTLKKNHWIKVISDSTFQWWLKWSVLKLHFSVLSMKKKKKFKCCVMIVLINSWGNYFQRFCFFPKIYEQGWLDFTSNKELSKFQSFLRLL